MKHPTPVSLLCLSRLADVHLLRAVGGWFCGQERLNYLWEHEMEDVIVKRPTQCVFYPRFNKFQVHISNRFCLLYVLICRGLGESEQAQKDA